MILWLINLGFGGGGAAAATTGKMILVKPVDNRLEISEPIMMSLIHPGKHTAQIDGLPRNVLIKPRRNIITL